MRNNCARCNIRDAPANRPRKEHRSRDRKRGAALERRRFSAARSRARSDRRTHRLFGARRRVCTRPALLSLAKTSCSRSSAASSAPSNHSTASRRASDRPDAWASPAGQVCIISSRTTIGVALIPAIFALCAKCDVLVKDREDSLITAFFETLAEELDELALAARSAKWDSNSTHAPDIGSFDAVVAFGSDQTLAAISRDVRPGARFIGYGSRASAGYIARESLSTQAGVKAHCARSRSRSRAIRDRRLLVAPRAFR